MLLVPIWTKHWHNSITCYYTNIKCITMDMQIYQSLMNYDVLYELKRFLALQNVAEFYTFTLDSSMVLSFATPVSLTISNFTICKIHKHLTFANKV